MSFMTAMKYEFISEYKGKFKMQKMCRHLGVSQSGYYKHIKNYIKSKPNQYKELAELMIKIEDENEWELGGEGLKQALKGQGITIGLSKIYKIKRLFDIYPKTSKKRRHNIKKYKDNITAENLLNREFHDREINKVWVCDIKYIPTEEGWDYLATVMDLGSRRIVGFAQGERMTVGLTMKALEMAISYRKPEKGLICHSDRGSQYTCAKYQKLISGHGYLSSMSKPGTPYDNACAESFFATLEKNFLSFNKFKTRKEARHEIWVYIEGRYNSKRMHSAIGWISPVNYEKKLIEEKSRKIG